MSPPLESLLAFSGPVLAMAVLRAAGLVWVLPWSHQLPIRARVGIAIALGLALAGANSATNVQWSVAASVSEFLTGLSLGAGLRAIILALSSAGSWIDEQVTTGLSSEPFGEEADESTSGTAQLMIWLGTWFILTSIPGRNWTVIENAFASLKQIPLGQEISPNQIPTRILDLLRSGSELALAVALPAFLIAGLVQGGLSLLGRGLGVSIAPAMSPARALISCGILMLVLPWQAERIDQAIGDHESTLSSEITR